MSGIILYKSKYGSTKKYAGWLANETGFELVETDKADTHRVCQYDTKKVMIFVCGASPYEENAFSTVVKHNVSDELLDIPFFYCRGAFDMSAMTFKDRTLCKLLRKALAKKDPKDYEVWEEALMEVPEGQRGDWPDRSYIQPILEAL